MSFVSVRRNEKGPFESGQVGIFLDNVYYYVRQDDLSSVALGEEKQIPIAYRLVRETHWSNLFTEVKNKSLLKRITKFWVDEYHSKYDAVTHHPEWGEEK